MAGDVLQGVKVVTGPLFEMPASVELTWAEYRLVIRALDDAEMEVEGWGSAYDDLLGRIREALQVLLLRVWPDLGDIDDGGTIEP